MSQEWRLHARCRGAPKAAQELAFGEAIEQQAFIASYCHGCPVLQACGEYGWDEPGVYGGMTERKRRHQTEKAVQAEAEAEAVRADPVCGTVPGYRRHRETVHDVPCAPCRAAWARYCKERKRIRLGRTA